MRRKNGAVSEQKKEEDLSEKLEGRMEREGWRETQGVAVCFTSCGDCMVTMGKQ